MQLPSFRRSLVTSLFAATLALGLTGNANAQANTDPSIDVRLGILGNCAWLDREGTFPNGMNASSMNTTVCNQGGEVNWFRAMDPDHPFIAFLVARENNGRFEQISNRSYVKHGFFALTSSQCTSCTPPSGLPGQKLGVGCSDTYDINNNGDNFWLAPPDEIDPWTGEWDPNCSYFDLGLVPGSCDGTRSLSQSQVSTLGPIGNRIHLSDADLNVAGASYWYQAQYVVAREAESKRFDNLGSRGIDPVWDGIRWSLFETTTMLHDTILQRWVGASLDSATNGSDDGRVYVAVKVTGPTEGLYRYEFAVHNRDNARGVSEFRVPLCDGARVLNAGFRDVDGAGANDWTSAVTPAGTELVFSDGSGANALRWNTIFNFWFDSDAAPAGTNLTLTQADAGGGAPSLSIGSQAPLELYNVYAGDGCSNDGTPPVLYAEGTPARATLGNATFSLVSTGSEPGQVHVLAASDSPNPGMLTLGACTMWLDGTLGIEIYAFGSSTTDGSGTATYSVPVPNDIALEGVTIGFQGLGINPGGGPAFNLFEFSNGLQVRIGDSISSCP